LEEQGCYIIDVAITVVNADRRDRPTHQHFWCLRINLILGIAIQEAWVSFTRQQISYQICTHLLC